jgi:hypothetical protein
MMKQIDRQIFLSEQYRRDQRDRKLAKWLGLFFAVYFGGHLVAHLYKNW